MTTPDSFATTDQAAAYGYVLPAATAAGLLARATQAIRDAAGYPVTQTTATLRVQADFGWLALPSLTVTAVSSVALVNDDGTTTAETDWRWRGGNRIWLGSDGIRERDRLFGEFEVVFVHGFAVIPDALVMLTGAVAFRLAATPVAATAGIKSQTVGSVSWTAGDDMPGAALTEAETRTLARIVPVQRAWQVPA